MDARRIVTLLVQLRWWSLAATACLTLAIVAAFAAYGGLDFDRRIENMFAADDPLLPPYQRVKRLFGGNEIVLAVYHDPQLFAADGVGIRRLETVANRLGQVPGVASVLSLHDLDQVIASIPRGVFTQAPGAGETIVDADNRLSVAYLDLFRGYTHGPDRQTAAVVCILARVEETTSRAATIGALETIIQDLPDGLAAGTLAGEPVMVIEGFSLVERDGEMLAKATLVLLAATILLLFRSLRWVVIPLGVVLVTLMFTQAALVVSGLELSMVSSMLTAIVTVVGIATVIHIIVRFREARARDATPRQALIEVGSLLCVPIFWACCTDAAGFAALMIAEVGPVQDFGVMMAIGSLMVLVAVATVVPGLALLGRFDADPHQAWGENRLQAILASTLRLIRARRRLLAMLTVAVLCGAVWGLGRLEVETDFTKNFHANNKIVTSYETVEDDLGGAGVWDLIVPAPRVLTADYLERVRSLETRLRSLTEEAADGMTRPALTKVLSIVDAIDAMENHPLLSLAPAELRAQAMSAKMPHFFAALRAEDGATGETYLRVMLRARERQPAEQKLRLIAAVQAEAARFGESTETAGTSEVTGFFVLLANLIQSMIRDQWICFAVAAVAIGCMMTVAFRSPTLAALALVPNALPILVVLGGMGWLGVRINMGAAMIAAVSMGLSVDSSIHYIFSFQRAIAGGRTVVEALDEVQQTVGRAVVFSTLALIVGFLVLCTSEFIPTVYFGALVSLSMLGGLAGNLLVLPLLITLVYGKSIGES